MQERHKDYRTYFEESILSSVKYYIPYIKGYVALDSGRALKVLEVGCGLGGNLFPFAEMGCKVSGVDIDALSIEYAKTFYAERGVEADLTCEDIHAYVTDAKYDLILLHDAIEHITDKEKLMHRLRSLLADDGLLYVAFPAWCMPFGGHQQVCRSFLSHCPFIHLLPRKLYIWLLRKFGETEGTVRSLMDTRNAKMPIQAFQGLCDKTDLETINRTLYFINPHYEVKFGLKPRKLWRVLAAVPYLRDFFSTSCHYLLRKR